MSDVRVDTVAYPRVQCAWCDAPMAPGDPLTSWRQKPYHPLCWQTARTRRFTRPI